MQKVIDSAEAAVALIPDGATIMMGGFGLCGHSRESDRRAPSPRHARPHHHQQQRRHRRLRHRAAAQVAPGAEDDLHLRRREQGVRAPVPAEGNRGRTGAAGHVLRAHPRGGRGHRRLLHADRRRHAGGRGQGNARDRRAAVRARDAAPGRLRLRAGVERRPRRQPRLPEDRAQLQPDDGHRGSRHHRRGRAPGRARVRIEPDLVHTPGIFVQHILLGQTYERRIEKRTTSHG